MAILKRIRRKEYQGFKDFVKSLETMKPGKRQEIVELALIEDGRYMEWVIRNLLSLKSLLKLTSEDVTLIVQRMRHRPMELFAKALHKTEIRDQFVNDILPNKYVPDFREETEFLKDLKPFEQDGARNVIFQEIRAILEDGIAMGIAWNLPPLGAIKGFLDDDQKNGIITFNYENGQPWAKGEMKSGKKVGPWEHFYPNGKLLAQGEYKNDYKEGPWIIYYPNGQKKSEGDFLDDAREGAWKRWDIKGNPLN